MRNYDFKVNVTSLIVKKILSSKCSWEQIQEKSCLINAAHFTPAKTKVEGQHERHQLTFLESRSRTSRGVTVIIVVRITKDKKNSHSFVITISSWLLLQKRLRALLSRKLSIAGSTPFEKLSDTWLGHGSCYKFIETRTNSDSLWNLASQHYQ